MAPLNFNLSGYLFQEGVRTLQKSFNVALEALDDEIGRSADEAYGYQQEVEQGGEWIGERDADGVIIWDHTDVLAMKSEQAVEARSALCKAFVIALYHQWERSILAWTDSLKGLDHKGLVKIATKKGLTVDHRMDALRDLVNALKHNSAKCGKALAESWPALLPEGAMTKSQITDWYEVIRLQDTHVTKAFEFVLSSGPSASLNPQQEAI